MCLFVRMHRDATNQVVQAPSGGQLQYCYVTSSMSHPQILAAWRFWQISLPLQWPTTRIDPSRYSFLSFMIKVYFSKYTKTTNFCILSYFQCQSFCLGKMWKLYVCRSFLKRSTSWLSVLTGESCDFTGNWHHPLGKIGVAAWKIPRKHWEENMMILKANNNNNNNT